MYENILPHTKNVPFGHKCPVNKYNVLIIKIVTTGQKTGHGRDTTGRFNNMSR
jgi:hypothetical protein